jgi:hypothetical protein
LAIHLAAKLADVKDGLSDCTTVPSVGQLATKWAGKKVEGKAAGTVAEMAG